MLCIWFTKARLHFECKTFKINAYFSLCHYLSHEWWSFHKLQLLFFCSSFNRVVIMVPTQWLLCHCCLPFNFCPQSPFSQSVHKWVAWHDICLVTLDQVVIWPHERKWILSLTWGVMFLIDPAQTFFFFFCAVLPFLFLISSIFDSYHTKTECVSPWYNCSGWLGVKHQVTYLNMNACGDTSTLLQALHGWSMSDSLSRECLWACFCIIHCTRGVMITGSCAAIFSMHSLKGPVRPCRCFHWTGCVWPCQLNAFTGQGVSDLVSAFTGQGVSDLVSAFTEQGVSDLVSAFTGQGVSDLVSAFTGQGVSDFVSAFIEQGESDIVNAFTEQGVSDYVSAFTEQGESDLVNAFTEQGESSSCPCVDWTVRVLICSVCSLNGSVRLRACPWIHWTRNVGHCPVSHGTGRNHAYV